MPVPTATTPLQPMERRVAIPRQLSISALRRPTGVLQTLGGTTMGTSWTVKFAGAHGLDAGLRPLIQQGLDRVVAQMSPWERQSDLNRFNDGPCGSWQLLPPDFRTVIACALRIAAETDGACDPTLGALVDLWGFGPIARHNALPSHETIETALNASGWRNLICDPARGLMRQTALRLDLCGIAKGYAVDLIARTLREHGIIDALVEIGGELSGHGVKPDGTPWWVSVDAGTAGHPPLVIALHGLAIATSGCERNFAREGAIYSHTIDPRTGRPIDNGMITATVLHESCMQADAYATALMVMGAKHAITFANDKQLPVLIRYQAPTGVAEALSAPLQAMLED